jgi:hypothetical protein
MARTVADAALLLSALAGPDPADSATLAQPSRDPSVYTKALDRDALRGKRVGVIRVTHLAPGVLARFERSLHELRGLGATLVDPVDLGPALSVDEPELEVLLTELRTDLELYLGTRGASSPVRTLADLVRFNREHADVELAHFGQELFEDALKKGRSAIRSTWRPSPPAAKRRAKKASTRPSAPTRWICSWPHRWCRLAQRSLERRCLYGLLLEPRGGGRVSQPHGAFGRARRSADGHSVLRRRVERARAPGRRVCLRAGHSSPPRSALPRDRRLVTRPAKAPASGG